FFIGRVERPLLYTASTPDPRGEESGTTSRVQRLYSFGKGCGGPGGCRPAATPKGRLGRQSLGLFGPVVFSCRCCAGRRTAVRAGLKACRYGEARRLPPPPCRPG